jgi:hypothetical protein
MFRAGRVGFYRECHESGVLKLEGRIGEDGECLEKREWDTAGELVASFSKIS